MSLILLQKTDVSDNEAKGEGRSVEVIRWYD